MSEPLAAIQAIPKFRKNYLEYSEELPGLFGPVPWAHVERRLSDSRIMEAVGGGRPAGYYGTSTTNVLGIDVDEHQGRAWLGARPSDSLKFKYRAVTRALTVPSFSFKSPRGIHAYFLLADRLPAGILSALAAERVKGFAEVLPTPSRGLRLPIVSGLIHPETLEPAETVDLKYYHPAILFDDDFTAERVRGKIAERTGAGARLRFQTAKLLELESRFMPEKGGTNGPLVKLGTLYRAAGLTVDEAVRRFSVLLRGGGYRGELLDERRLRQRMESIFRHARAFRGKWGNHDSEPTLFDRIIAENLMAGFPFAAQRREPFRRFVFGILDWCNFQDRISAEPVEASVWNYIYPYRRFNLSRGYYPLPKSVLRRINKRYHDFIPELVGAGFLAPAPFGYSSRLGVCRHYSVKRLP